MKMKAAVLYKTGNPLVIEHDLEIPPLKEGQVLVRVLYSGVCHSQVMEARGRRGPDPWLPHLMGHEATAEVIETGTNVKKVHAGQRVVLTWLKGAGAETGGVIYRKENMSINAGAVTTFNEYAVVSENRCVPLPEGMPADVGSLLGCAVLTGAGILTNEIRPEPGSTMAFFGLGGIGMSALIATALFNCSMVIGVDVDGDKLAAAKGFGATHVVDAKTSDPVSMVMELTGGIGVDYAVEAAGSVRTIEQAFDSVRKGGGICVFASHPEHDQKICLFPHDLVSGKQIRGSWGGSSDPDRDIPAFGELYRSGKLPLEKLITNRYRLEEINKALDEVEAGRVVRALIELPHENNS